jgi:hypothetical protein
VTIICKTREYLFEVADPESSCDAELPLHPAIDDGVPIIQVLALDPPHLLHHVPRLIPTTEKLYAEEAE